MLLGPDRIDRVVHGALGHAHVDLERGWRTAVRSRNGGERRRRNLVPVGEFTGIRLNGRCCGCAGSTERGRCDERYGHQDDGSTTGHGVPLVSRSEARPRVPPYCPTKQRTCPYHRTGDKSTEFSIGHAEEGGRGRSGGRLFVGPGCASCFADTLSAVGDPMHFDAHAAV